MAQAILQSLLFMLTLFIVMCFKNNEQDNDVYGFTAKDIKGNDVDLSVYKGKVLLIVNVASECGYTERHYTELNELHSKYHEQGLEILAFPCNQFGYQEPGNNEDICTFTQSRGVQFAIFDKIDVNGQNAHPLFQFLKEKQSGTLGDFIKWNFTKFLVNRKGKPVGRYGPNYSPLEIEEDIINLLNEETDQEDENNENKEEL